MKKCRCSNYLHFLLQEPVNEFRAENRTTTKWQLIENRCVFLFVDTYVRTVVHIRSSDKNFFDFSPHTDARNKRYSVHVKFNGENSSRKNIRKNISQK